MNTVSVLAFVAVPFFGLVALLFALNRWGRKRDPMRPSKMAWLSTNGTQHRDRSHRD